MISEKIFPSKLLLFGEYAVVSGGVGLAIPYPAFQLQLKKQLKNISPYKIHLENYYNFLVQQNTFHFLNLQQFKLDLTNGLEVFSSIPIGYGVGSSGALVAAIFDTYASVEIKSVELNKLQHVLAEMEHFFHLKSSGIDPLVCYLQKEIYLKENKEIEIIQNLQETQKKFTYALYDCGFPRQTQHFVEIFTERMKDKEYKDCIENKYLPLTKNCIESYLIQNEVEFKLALKKLSLFQIEYFNFAIPKNVIQIWLESLKEGNTFFKLCGAGGGGFMIQFQFPN